MRHNRTCGAILIATVALSMLYGLSLGVQQASAMSSKESASFVALLGPPDNGAIYHTYWVSDVVSTPSGLAYVVNSKTEWYDYNAGVIGTVLRRRDLGLAFVSVTNSRLLYSEIDWYWYDESGTEVKHRFTSVNFKYIGKIVIADCVAQEEEQYVIGHFEIRGADMIDTQRIWYEYELCQKDYSIGKNYKFYHIYFANILEEADPRYPGYWFSTYDVMKLVEETKVTVQAGTFHCYHFQRMHSQTPSWAMCDDEYAMVRSKIWVLATTPGYIRIELTEYRR